MWGPALVSSCIINITAPIYFWMTDKVRGDVWGLETWRVSHCQNIIKVWLKYAGPESEVRRQYNTLRQTGRGRSELILSANVFDSAKLYYIYSIHSTKSRRWEGRNTLRHAGRGWPELILSANVECFWFSKILL